MIVNNLHIASIPIRPSETQSPLIVDADAILAPALTFQGFQAVAGWAIHVMEDNGAVQLSQFPLRNPFEGTKARDAAPLVETLRVLAAKGLDHTPKV